MQKYFFIETFGCQMNVHDSEKISGMLLDLGYKPINDYLNANIIILNTCCVRNSAENRVIGRVGDLKTLKDNNKSLIIAVVGCMMQQYEASQKLIAKFPFIDITLGTSNLNTLPYLIKEVTEKMKLGEKYEKNYYQDFPISSTNRTNTNSPINRSSWPHAWVSIMSGCNNFCTYCIVPYVRGREISRNPQEIIDEVKILLELGYKEITLLGQNVNSYGNDRNDGWNFNKLLLSLTNFNIKYRLRFMTSHPKDLSLEVINTIANSTILCKHIHLPLQSGSDKILSAMNRKYTSKEYLYLIEKIKNIIPNVQISTDIMVGFPEETDEDFNDTIQLLKNIKFSNAFMFVYSIRNGTPASKLTQIDASVKKSRITKLIAEQNIITHEISKNYINNTYEVLVEDKLPNNFYLGRTDNGKLVKFSSKDDIVGTFVNIKILDNKSSSLIGEIVK